MGQNNNYKIEKGYMMEKKFCIRHVQTHVHVRGLYLF